MPRKKPEPMAPVVPTTSLVASSVRYPGKSTKSFYHPKQDWQAECYRHYAICGEARFAAKFFGHAVSRAVLSTAEIVDGVVKESTTGPAADALAALFNGKDGQTQMLDAIGTHLTIAGECYLVGRHTPDGDIWEIVSCVEMQVTGQTWQIKMGEGIPAIVLTEDDVVIRIWLPHPARRIEADSPFRALLPILAEIEWLTRHVYAQVTSRLAGAGILMMPQGMSFPPPPAIEGQEQAPANDADAFMLTLAEAMMTPISDPGSPSAMVPIVVTAPDEAIDKARLLTFWTQLDAEAKALRSEAIHRFATGMDLPSETITGLSSGGGTGGGRSQGINHWTAWAIEEQTIKMHVEPMLDAVVNALTISYLRPTMDGDSTAVIIYDTSSLRLRPDRSKESIELWDRGVLSTKAMLRETGFNPDDMPDEAEFKRWLLIKVASGSATPEQVQAALAQLGVALNVAPLDGGSGQTRESRPAPSLEDHPPAKTAPNQSALVAAAEALVFRAMERAGNRLRNNGSKPPGVPAYETHMYVKGAGKEALLLDDAWSCADKVLDGVADFNLVVPVLNSYCSMLIANQQAHERATLAEWLSLTEAIA